MRSRMLYIFSVFIASVFILLCMVDIFIQCIPLPQDVVFSTYYYSEIFHPDGIGYNPPKTYMFLGRNHIMCVSASIETMLPQTDKEWKLSHKIDFSNMRESYKVIEKDNVITIGRYRYAIRQLNAFQKIRLLKMLNEIYDEDIIELEEKARWSDGSDFLFTYHIGGKQGEVRLHILDEERNEYVSSADDKIVALAVKMVQYSGIPRANGEWIFKFWVDRHDGNVVKIAQENG